MTTLGVNAAGESAYLSFVDGDDLQDLEPYILTAPKGLTPEEAVVALRDDMRKILSMHGVTKLRLLNPESSYSPAYVSIVGRCTLETIIIFAGAELGVDAARIQRSTVRTILGLPKKGTLSSHVPHVVEALGRHWSPQKRDVAALAALAGARG